MSPSPLVLRHCARLSLSILCWAGGAAHTRCQNTTKYKGTDKSSRHQKGGRQAAALKICPTHILTHTHHHPQTRTHIDETLTHTHTHTHPNTRTWQGRHINIRSVLHAAESIFENLTPQRTGAGLATFPTFSGCTLGKFLSVNVF